MIDSHLTFHIVGTTETAEATLICANLQRMITRSVSLEQIVEEWAESQTFGRYSLCSSLQASLSNQPPNGSKSPAPPAFHWVLSPSLRMLSSFQSRSDLNSVAIAKSSCCQVKLIITWLRLVGDHLSRDQLAIAGGGEEEEKEKRRWKPSHRWAN